MSGVGDLQALDPGAVAAWLGHGLPTGVVRRLMMMPRFSPRVAELVDARIGELPKRLEPVQGTALSLDRWSMEGLLLRVGAVWFGRRIGRMIDGASVRALVGAIGPELRQIALQHRELAPEQDGLNPDAGVSEADAIAADIERQGIACVKTWCMKQPSPLALRMELRLPRKPPPGEMHVQAAPVIVETLLWALGK